MSGPDDVRMRGFAERADVEEVERFLAERAEPLGNEEVASVACAGRVLAAAIDSPVDLSLIHISEPTRLQ